jgi:hypothetical protein
MEITNVEFDGKIKLHPVNPNGLYQVSEDGGNTWENITLNDKGEAQWQFEQNRSYHFRMILKKAEKRTERTRVRRK